MRNAFDRLPRETQDILIRLVPGLRVWVPKVAHVAAETIIAAVVARETDGDTQRRACQRVATHYGIHPDTVWRILRRARLARKDARCGASVVDPEHGQGPGRDRSL